jgi:ribonuclease HI
MKLPSKIKIFLWRALHGIVLLKSILANRHIGTSGKCPVCLSAPENVMHLLFQCNAAREVWAALGIQNIIDDAISVDLSGSAVLEFLLRDQTSSMLGFNSINLKETIGVTCWYLWWRRRRRTYDESVPRVYKCKMSILSITSNAARVGSKVARANDRWVKPEVRQTKINVDGSFHDVSHAEATGVVARDHEGLFLAAASKFYPNMASAAMVEALAMKEGLSLANRLGCNNVMMESDSLETIEARTGDEAWWGDSSAVFADCVDLCSMIDKISFKHCSRMANEVAHEIARDCYSSESSCNWVAEPPSFLLEKLINDVTIL